MKAHSQEVPTPSARSRHVDDDLKRMRAHEEAILDEALDATFPCSDPVSSLSVDESLLPVDQDSKDLASLNPKHS